MVLLAVVAGLWPRTPGRATLVWRRESRLYPESTFKTWGAAVDMLH